MTIDKCPACNSDDINYVEIYNNAMTRIVRSGDKKQLYFVESSGGDLLTSRYVCDYCKRAFVEDEIDGTVKVLEKDSKKLYDP
jgi:acyl-CoA thioesterase FadM